MLAGVGLERSATVMSARNQGGARFRECATVRGPRDPTKVVRVSPHAISAMWGRGLTGSGLNGYAKVLGARQREEAGCRECAIVAGPR